MRSPLERRFERTMIGSLIATIVMGAAAGVTWAFHTVGWW